MSKKILLLTFFLSFTASAAYLYGSVRLTGDTMSGGLSTPLLKDTGLTENRALTSTALKEVTVSVTSDTELAYLSGTTSAVQTQLNAKVPTSRTVNGQALSSDVSLALSNLTDTSISGVSSNQALVYNGSAWVNQALGVGTAGAGSVTWYLDDTAPLTFDDINHLSTSPNTTTPEAIDSVTITSSSGDAFIEQYMTNTTVGISTIPAGVWDYYFWTSVNNLTGTPISNVIADVGYMKTGAGTVTITGTLTSRTATTTLPMFVAGDANANVHLAGYLNTPNGNFQITDFTSVTVATITTPSAYSNESAVSYYVTRPLFQGPNIPAQTTTLTAQDVSAVQSSFAVDPSYYLSMRIYANTNSSTLKVISFSHNGTNRFSHLVTPLSIEHNQLAGVQGCIGSDCYHLGATQHTLATSTATSSQTGLLNSSDWSAFNAKVNRAGDTMSGGLVINNTLNAGASTLSSVSVSGLTRLADTLYFSGPSMQIGVASAISPYLAFANTVTDAYGTIQESVTGFVINSTYSNYAGDKPLIFQISDIEKMRLSSTGKFLIGTNAEIGSNALVVNGSAYMTGATSTGNSGVGGNLTVSGTGLISGNATLGARVTINAATATSLTNFPLYIAPSVGTVATGLTLDSSGNGVGYLYEESVTGGTYTAGSSAYGVVLGASGTRSLHLATGNPATVRETIDSSGNTTFLNGISVNGNISGSATLTGITALTVGAGISNFGGTVNMNNNLRVGFSQPSPGNVYLLIGTTANVTNGASAIRMYNSNTQYNWQISENFYSAGYFELTPSDGPGSMAFTGPSIFRISPSGQVNILASNPTTAATMPIYLNPSVVTQGTGIGFNNGGEGTALLYIESVTGGTVVPGTSAYSQVLGTTGNRSLHFVTNNAVQGTISSTGAVSFPGAFSSGASTLSSVTVVGATNLGGDLLIAKDAPKITLTNTASNDSPYIQGGTAGGAGDGRLKLSGGSGRGVDLMYANGTLALMIANNGKIAVTTTATTPTQRFEVYNANEQLGIYNNGANSERFIVSVTTGTGTTFRSSNSAATSLPYYFLGNTSTEYGHWDTTGLTISGAVNMGDGYAHAGVELDNSAVIYALGGMSAFTLANTTGRAILAPTGTIANSTCIMPASPSQKQIVTISCSGANTITSFAVNPNSGQSLDNAPTTCVPPTTKTWMYSGTNWYVTQ